MDSESLVVITGASSGIGAALAATVPFERASVVDVSRRGGTPGTEHWPIDLADPAGWGHLETRLVERLAGFTGRVVCIHNAATLEPIGFAGEVDSAGYYTQVLLNSAAPQAVGHAFLKALAGTRKAQAYLWFLTSGAASKIYEGWSAYSSGKAAINQWVRTVAAEQTARGTGSHLIAVAPGVVATGLQEQIRSSDVNAFPDVERFHRLKDSNGLRDPVDTAKHLWSLMGRGLDSGAVVDLRTL